MRNRRAGFTLLEIIIAIFVVSLIIGISIPTVSGIYLEEQLRSTTRTLEEYSIRARTMATSEQKTYAVVFNPKGFDLVKAQEDMEGDLEPVMSHEWVKDAVCELMVWPERQWKKAARQVIYFYPEGLSMPVRFRIQIGAGMVEQVYNPLTARVVEESYVLP
jgi:prepilin-type N-terminal cleavage/methylation domain-containing protein